MSHRIVPRSLGMHEARPEIAQWVCLNCGGVDEMDVLEVTSCSPNTEQMCATMAGTNDVPGAAQTARAPAKTPGRS